MRIVRPISAHDAHLLELSLELMRHFGRLENHSITFAPAQSVAHLAEEAAASIADLSPNINVLPLAFEGQNTWPQSPNLHWTMTMEAMALIGNTEPIFWMELDCDPIIINWADIIETNWRKGRTPFCGKIVPKPSRNQAGAIVTEPDDTMMMGCGVYPPNISRMRNWDALVKGFHTLTETEPWDAFMRGWMRTAGWTATEAIGDRWNTINYREGLLCDPGPTQFRARDHSRTDISQACVVHGCKDGSLGRLILQQGAASIITPPASAFTPAVHAPIQIRQSGPLPAQPPAPFFPPTQFHPGPSEFEKQIMDTLSRMEKRLDDMAQSIGAITPPQATPEQPPAEAEAPTQEPAAPPETAAPKKTTPEIETIRGIVNGSKKLLRIGKLAGILHMGEEKLRKIITKKGSGLTLNRGYVGLAEAPPASTEVAAAA